MPSFSSNELPIVYTCFLLESVAPDITRGIFPPSETRCVDIYLRTASMKVVIKASGKHS